MLRDEWTEAIQMVADKLQRQEEERIQRSPTSNIDNMVEEEMDISTTHHKRKVARRVRPRFHGNAWWRIQIVLLRVSPRP